jgi:hypothetical protein
MKTDLDPRTPPMPGRPPAVGVAFEAEVAAP